MSATLGRAISIGAVVVVGMSAACPVMSGWMDPRPAALESERARMALMTPEAYYMEQADNLDRHMSELRRRQPRR